MKAVQRSYIYIATFVSLNAIVWATIFLLQNVLGSLDRTDLAWQLAVLVIATPIFAGHWIWAERIRGRDAEERPSLVRRFFLYITLAALLGPFIAVSHTLLRALLELMAGLFDDRGETILNTVITLVILAVVAFYMWRVLKEDRAGRTETPGQAIIRQLFQWGFTITGLVLVLLSINNIVQQLIQAAAPLSAGSLNGLIPEIVRLLIGTVVWIFFWRQLEHNFLFNISGERGSVLRKLFLYGLLLTGVVLVVTNLALLWDGILLNWFGRPVPGDLSDVVPPIISGVILWGYHWSVLRREAALAPLQKDQLLIRHIYQYLTAAVGLAAGLVGIGGLISLLILAAAGDPVNSEGLAGFIATLTAGVPVWLWPWWQIQQRASGSGERAQGESGSLIRRIYLYFFLLIATLTILGSGIYLVFRLFSLLFQLNNTDSNTDLALAVAYAGLALVVWLYHGRLLQRDSRRQAAERAEKLSDVTIVIIEEADDHLAEPLTEALRHKMPHVGIDTVRVPLATTAEIDPLTPLATADIVVASWPIGQQTDERLKAALATTTAEKVLVPTAANGWQWAGVDDDRKALLKETAAIVEKMALREGGISRRRWGIGQIIAVLAGGVVLLCILSNIIGGLLGAFF